jgi:hypothetical protein
MTSKGPDWVAKRCRGCLLEPAHLHHASSCIADIEDAVRLLVEVRHRAYVGRRLGHVGAPQLLPVLDEQPDGPQLDAVHAAIHGKDQFQAAVGEIVGER